MSKIMELFKNVENFLRNFEINSYLRRENYTKLNHLTINLNKDHAEKNMTRIEHENLKI